jgi:c(7)-type cytochrome triheme protein
VSAHRPWIVAVAAVIALVAVAAAGSAQVKAPADFAFEQGKESPAPVTFSHEKHRAAGADKCTFCHTKVFKMKKGADAPLTMERMKKGELCGTCHTGKAALVPDKVAFNVDDKANCERCHKK